MSHVPVIEINQEFGPRLVLTSGLSGEIKRDLCLNTDGILALSGESILPLHFKSIPPLEAKEEIGTSGWSKRGFITHDLLEGDYSIDLSFNWRASTSSKSFRAEVVLDGDYDNPLWEMEQRPRSSNSKQKQPASINIPMTGITAGTHTVELWYSCEDTNKVAYMSHVYMKIIQES
jgi:hypothetical protein